MKSKLLLRPRDFKSSFERWEVISSINPAAFRLPNKKIVLYVRIAESADSESRHVRCPVIISRDYETSYEMVKKKDILAVGQWGEMYLKNGVVRLPHISHLKRVILSSNGLGIEKIEQRPAFVGVPDESEYGVEDPRVTKIGKKYYMTYVGVSQRSGISTYLAYSSDGGRWKRNGIIFREQNKDVVLFPEKIKGEYVALNRPESSFKFMKPSIWISYSRDLIYWGKDKNLMRPRDGWEKTRIGGGTPPVKTKKGWLILYHGVNGRGKKRVYSAGAVLLDLKNPQKIIARSPSDKPLIKPGERFEKNGYIDNVVFPTGAVEDLDKKHLLVYSGGADSVTSVRKIKIDYIFRHMGL